MELRHLRYFIAVAGELNFSRAARRLHLSQPPLSRQIKDLESELGVALFERRKNSIALTPAGEFLLGKAKRLLEESDELLRQARRLAEAEQQQLQIGYIANVQGRLVIEAATMFRKAHPDVTVKVFDLTTAEQVARLVSGKLDLGFVGFREAPAGKGLLVEQIGTTYAVMALRRDHPLATGRRQPLARFKDEPFVTISEQAFPGARQYVFKFCQEAGFQPRIVHEAVQPMDILNLVAIGEGVALVPENMRHAPHPDVTFCQLREPVPRADSCVAWKRGNNDLLLPDFIRAAKASYAALMRSSANRLKSLSPSPSKHRVALSGTAGRP